MNAFYKPQAIEEDIPLSLFNTKSYNSVGSIQSIEENKQEQFVKYDLSQFKTDDEVNNMPLYIKTDRRRL